MAWVFWSCLAVLGFTYAGYPLLMALLARTRPKPIRRLDQAPAMDVLVVAHDAADMIEDKIDNLLELDYPPDRLRINIVCDGCSDDTALLIGRRLSPRVRLHAFPTRRGKSACIGNVLPILDRELVLFTDVRQRLDPQAARELAAALGDPDVGAASGELVLQASNDFGRGIDAYWRYEKLIRRWESSSGSLVGVTGAIYAARREALPEVPPGLILDDMWIPLGVASVGYRVVFVPSALAYDLASSRPGAEQVRKRRTLAGNFQLLRRWPDLALPGAHPLAWRLWGHKWLRLLAPWLLVLAFASNAALASEGWPYAMLLALQVLAYGLVALGRWRPTTQSWLPVRLCTAFFSLNLSAALALADFLRNPESHLWRTTRVEGAAP
jgi:biofilm PGA synthesis N-glycosyltransferase PgaC